MDEYIAAGADRERYDEPYLDSEFNPITPQQLLDRIRELERKTGEKMIFQRAKNGPNKPRELRPMSCSPCSAAMARVTANLGRLAAGSKHVQRSGSDRVGLPLPLACDTDH